MNRSKYRYLIIFCIAFIIMSVSRISNASDQPLDFDWQSFSTDGGVFGLSWSPDSQRVAFGEQFGIQILIFNLQTSAIEKQVRLPPLSEFDGQALTAWSPDGSTIAVVRHDVYMVDAQSGDIVKTYPTDSFSSNGQKVYIQDVKWSNDSQLFAALDSSGYIYVVDFKTSKIVTTIDLGGYNGTFIFPYFDWSRDNTLFAVPLFKSSPIHIGLWTKDGKPSPDYMKPNEYNVFESDCDSRSDDTEDPMPVSWSKDSKNLAIGATDLIVCQFEVDHTIKMLTVDDKKATSVIWSPDDHWLVSTNDVNPDCWTDIFDAKKNFEHVETLQGTVCSIFSMAWSPDGQYLAAGSDMLWLGKVTTN